LLKSNEPDFGCGRGRRDASTHKEDEKALYAGDPLFFIVLHDGEDRKTLALPRFVLPAPLYFPCCLQWPWRIERAEFRPFA
jgi:hypothetical protein